VDVHRFLNVISQIIYLLEMSEFVLQFISFVSNSQAGKMAAPLGLPQQTSVQAEWMQQRDHFTVALLF
jgi:hypothetical protein